MNQICWKEKAGQKYGHYTPDTKVVLVEGGEGKQVSEKLAKLLESYRSKGQKSGFSSVRNPTKKFQFSLL